MFAVWPQLPSAITIKTIPGTVDKLSNAPISLVEAHSNYLADHYFGFGNAQQNELLAYIECTRDLDLTLISDYLNDARCR